jgi:Zn-dependent peptidase ImmA (M78 family)
VYGRPLAVFYLDEVPKDFSVIKDFRKLPETADRGAYPYELSLLIRELQARQEWLREILQELRSRPLPFVNSATVNSSANRVAHSIRKTLRLTVQEQLGFSNLNQALNSWVDKAESIRCVVCQSSSRGKLPVEAARGFALVDKYAPFVFLNSKDSLGGRIFTLAHELAHVWLGASGVSNDALNGDPGSSLGRIERFCNQVASEVVFPAELFRDLFPDVMTEKDAIAEIASAARSLSVSRDVVARRLKDNGVISPSSYQKLHEQYVREWRSYSPQSGGQLLRQPLSRSWQGVHPYSW